MAEQTQAISADIALLRRLAVVTLDEENKPEIRAQIQAIEKANGWTNLINSAERHGLSNILYKHLTDLGIELPPAVKQPLLALKVRHRRANTTRQNATQEILAAFAEKNIQSAILKGAALIHVLYDAPELRPMSDIDILVSPEDAQDAQQCLRDIGYDAEHHKTGFMADHHHLPMASKMMDGISINIEIHHDSLSGDVADSIALNNLSEPLRAFESGDQTGHALGHIDMLRHLCHHTFEPIANIKLGAIADLYGYAHQYEGEIDWPRLKSERPFVTNIFRMMHYLSPLPKALEPHIEAPTAKAPNQIGQGYPPMTETLANHNNKLAKLKHLFSAPDWWLHCFYHLPPEKSLTMTKLVKHPLQVTKWLIRRFRANLKDRTSA